MFYCRLGKAFGCSFEKTSTEFSYRLYIVRNSATLHLWRDVSDSELTTVINIAAELHAHCSYLRLRDDGDSDITMILPQYLAY